MDNLFYEEELEKKDREISILEENLNAAWAEIRRLHGVCREYQEEIELYKSMADGQ